MKYLILSIVFLSSFAISGKGLNTATEPKNNTVAGDPVRWELVWEDNFDVAGLPNPNIWDTKLDIFVTKKLSIIQKSVPKMPELKMDI